MAERKDNCEAAKAKHMAREDYIRVQYAQPHPQRTRELLKAHPELSQLVGNDPKTFLYLLLIVGIQIAIAAFIANYSWWVMVLMAWTVGAFANHACFVINHDATHNLVLRGNTRNLIVQIISNMAFFFPAAGVCFRYYHLHHHRYQGQLALDADLAGPLEAKIFGRTVIGKIVWLLFFFLIEGITRPLRIGSKIHVINAWVVGSFIYQVVFLMILGWAFGWLAPAYLALSTVAGVGLHPLGARWIQEHYVFKEGQETYSYYGPFNNLMFNVGYHNEHHDLMGVPWSRLKKIKTMAPEFYEPLMAHDSYWMLLAKFIFDKNVSLYDRVVRPDHGKAKEPSQKIAHETLYAPVPANQGHHAPSL